MTYKPHWTDYIRRYLQSLKEVVEAAKARGKEIQKLDEFKMLMLLREAMLDRVLPNPASREFLLGDTLGSAHKNWRRVKFKEPLKRYRLFFAFSSKERSVCYVWINGSQNLRSTGSHGDCYAVFSRMLDSGQVRFPYPNCTEDQVEDLQWTGN